jgi:hypothetical protein
MARLKQKDATVFYELSAETIVGRAATAMIRLQQPYVSSHHATLRWTERRSWELRDLQSKNGTYVNGTRVGTGAKIKLEPGNELGFGSLSETYVVDDVSPPRAMLVAVEGESSPIFLDQLLLPLPSPEQPDVTLFQAASGHWQLESRDRDGPLKNGDLIQVGTQQWRCCLPTAPDETEALARVPDLSALSDVEVQLFVSRDEEHVEVTLHTNGRDVPLGSKACFYLLLTMGRCRLRRDLPPGTELTPDGWIAIPALLELLRVSEQRLNVDIFRIRQELRSAGIVDAAAIVERQPQRRRLRLGTHRVVIRQAAPSDAAPSEAVPPSAVASSGSQRPELTAPDGGSGAADAPERSGRRGGG